MLFARHYAQAEPCGPSRASLYTSMYLHDHGVYTNGIPLITALTNLALEARQDGYRPALFGYTDITEDVAAPTPENHAHPYADDVLPGMIPVSPLGGNWSLWFDRLKSNGYDILAIQADIFRPQSTYLGSAERGQTYPPAKYKDEDEDRNTAFLVDEVIDYISGEHASPRLVHLSFFSPHPPFVAPEPYHALYDADAIALPMRQATPSDEAKQHPWLQQYLYDEKGAGFAQGAVSHENLPLSDRGQRQIRATNFGMISEVDAQIGRLIDFLKVSGTYDDTKIVFTSDHGEGLGNHWLYAKYSYFEKTFHVPMIISDPAPEARCADGQTVNAFTESIDIMPTILDLIGRRAPAQCDWSSLRGFCRSQQPEGWRQEYYAEFDLRAPWEGKKGAPLGLRDDQCMISMIRGSR